MRYAVILFAFLLAGCFTPQQKLNRLLRKYPELMDSTAAVTTRTDTTAKDTAVIVPADSASITLPDTTTQADVTQGRVRIRYIRLPGKAVYIDCKCDTASVRVRTYMIRVTRTFPLPVVKEVPKPVTFWQKLALYLLVFVALAAGYFIGKTLNK